MCTDYALTTLSAIFPKTLKDNIAFLLTHVSSPLRCNFSTESIPQLLQHAPQFLLDNPSAQKKKFQTLSEDPSMKGHIQAMHDELLASETATLRSLVELFDWLTTVTLQPTAQIVELYQKVEKIELKISNTLAYLEQASEKSKDADRLRKKVEAGKAVRLGRRMW